MGKLRIRIGRQEQSKKPVYLLANGTIQCGSYRYQGRLSRQFKDYYGEILALTSAGGSNDELDVSGCRIWDAISIYDEIVVREWKQTISATKLRKLADETEIRMKVNHIACEFGPAVRSKWSRLFKKAGADSREKIKNPWQIL